MAQSFVAEAAVVEDFSRLTSLSVDHGFVVSFGTDRTGRYVILMSIHVLFYPVRYCAICDFTPFGQFTSDNFL